MTVEKYLKNRSSDGMVYQRLYESYLGIKQFFAKAKHGMKPLFTQAYRVEMNDGIDLYFHSHKEALRFIIMGRHIMPKVKANLRSIKTIILIPLPFDQPIYSNIDQCLPKYPPNNKNYIWPTFYCENDNLYHFTNAEICSRGVYLNAANIATDWNFGHKKGFYWYNNLLFQKV